MFISIHILLICISTCLYELRYVSSLSGTSEAQSPDFRFQLQQQFPDAFEFSPQVLLRLSEEASKHLLRGSMQGVYRVLVKGY